MVPRSHEPIRVAFIGFIVMCAVVLALFGGPEHWLMAIAVFIGFLINGYLAVLEDDMPGGFNNPDGTRTPPYVDTVGLIARWTAGVLCWSTAAGVLVAAFYGWFEWRAALWMTLAISCVGVAALARRAAIKWMFMAIPAGVFLGAALMRHLGG